MKLPPLERRQRSEEASTIAEAMRRFLTLQPHRALDLWLPFPQNGCTFGFGRPPGPLPIGTLLILWNEGKPFTLPCPDCADTLRVVSFGGLLTIGGGRMICVGCDAEFYQPWGGGLAVVASILQATGLRGTEFAPTTTVFGGSIASDGSALLAELELPPLNLKPQSQLRLVDTRSRSKAGLNMQGGKRAMDWNDEQSAVDAFVDAVQGTDPELARAAGERLVQQRFDGEWQPGDAVEEGTTLLEFHIVPSLSPDEISHPGLELFEGVVSTSRLADLSKGADFTPEELALWRRSAAEAIVNENPDYDDYPAWEILRETHSNGAVAFLGYLAGGYSFTEPWHKYFCAARTLEQALEQLREVGFTDVDDVRSRWASKIQSAQ